MKANINQQTNDITVFDTRVIKYSLKQNTLILKFSSSVDYDDGVNFIERTYEQAGRYRSVTSEVSKEYLHIFNSLKTLKF